MRRLVAAMGVACLVATACTAPEAAPAPSPPPATTTVPPAVDAAPSPSPTPEDHTVVMWARGGLAADVATRATDLPGVVAAAHVRSDTLGLTGSRDSQGRPVDELDPGWRIPVEVMAVLPGQAAMLPDGPTRDAVHDLRPGEVLLPASSATLRRLDAGGRVDIGDRQDLVVAAVVEDDVLGRAEVVVHGADADAVGLDPAGSVRVLADGTAGASLASALARLAPADTAVRVVGATPDEPARRAPLVLSLPDVKSRFGEFAFRDDDTDREIRADPRWVDANIVVEDVPLLGRVRCHRAVVDDLARALRQVADAGFGEAIDPGLYGGCYHARRIGAGTSLSRHSWGIAVDINVDLSQPGLGPPPDPEVVEIFAANGFRWGGQFLSPDNHHFEWVGEAALRPPPDAGIGHTAPDGADRGA